MKKKLFYVYELIDPRNNKVFYVGKGTKGRMYEHVLFVKKGKVTNKNTKLTNKIKKILNLGFEIIYKKVFESSLEEICFKREIEIIEYYGLKNLCNLVTGGRGGTTKKQGIKISKTLKALYLSGGRIPWNKGLTKDSDARIAKGAEKNKGNNYSPSTQFKSNSIPWNAGKNMPADIYLKMIETKKRKGNLCHSEDTKERIRAKLIGRPSPMRGKTSSMKGKNHTKETCEKISKNAHWTGKFGKDNAHSKPVLQIDKFTEKIIKEWVSIKEAGSILSINQSHIGAVCSKSYGRKSAGGFKWEFKEIN